MASKSARALAKELNCYRVKGESKTFKPKNKLIVNWGNSTPPTEWSTDNWLNHPDSIKIASNKLLFYKYLSARGLSGCIPDFTTDIHEAREWLDGGHPVLQRNTLTGKGGEGCRYIEDKDELGAAPLYTKYFPKIAEYRVHVGPRGIFHVQQKRKVINSDADFKIRSHGRGWVFSIHNVDLVDNVLECSRTVVDSLPLDFGACDVLYNKHRNKAVVTEVNTACGLEGTTLEKYTEMIWSCS